MLFVAESEFPSSEKKKGGCLTPPTNTHRGRLVLGELIKWGLVGGSCSGFWRMGSHRALLANKGLSQKMVKIAL